MRKLVLALALAMLPALVPAQPANRADPNKVLRTAIIIAETGFDPQASQECAHAVFHFDHGRTGAHGF